MRAKLVETEKHPLGEDPPIVVDLVLRQVDIGNLLLHNRINYSTKDLVINVEVSEK